MEKLICMVIPPYFSRSHEEHLRSILLTEFGSNPSGMRFVIQPQAALANCAEEERMKIGSGGLVTVCHMEKEITTISQFIVKKSPGFELQELHSSIVVLGSFDIAERFQEYLEQRFEKAIALTEGRSGENILNEIIKSVHRKIADDPTAGIRSSRFTIGMDDMRERIFNPVLAVIFGKLNSEFNTPKGKRYILFSGVLGECPYVHSYMKERFDTAHNTEILETTDESTSSCQGAIFLLDEQCDVTIQRKPHEQVVTVHTTPESRLEYIKAIEARLDNKPRTTRSQSEYYGLLRKYEMILAERISRQGYDNPNTKATILSIEAIHREAGSSDRLVKQCANFADGYTYEMKHRVDPTDAMQQFSAIHLAAASNDYLALRIILAAGYSVHGLVEDRPLGHFDHTPLHVYAWYNNGPNECLDLLINAGAVALSVVGKPNQSPAHVAASKGRHQLLNAFERHYKERFSEECPGFLQLAIAEGQRETVKYLIEIGASVSPEETWMRFSPLTGACFRKILPPLCSALKYSWTDVATFIINKSLASLYNNGNFVPLLHSTATGQEAMILLLIRWADVDTDGKDEFGQTQLSWAARLGYEAVVQLLVDRGQAAADSRDKHSRSPLSWAASNGHTSTVQTLVRQKDVEIDSRDKYDRTPLLRAAKNGHETVVRLLFKKGADLAARDKFGQTALHLAAYNGHEAVVRLLLEKGADITAKYEFGELEQTALHLAAKSGHEAVVRLLLEKGANLAARDEFGGFGQTALHLAAKNGHEKVVRLLLKKGADLAAKDGFGGYGRTALHLAASRGHGAIVRLLLEKEADVATKAKDRQTALRLAASRGHEAVVRLLLEKGVDVAALHEAASGGHEAVARLLLEKGADLAAKVGFSEQTALHLAASRGHEAVVRLLLEEGADLAAKNKYRWTALHEAAIGGHEAVARLLLEKGADIAAKASLSEQTALHEAASDGHEAVARLLLEKGADVTTKNKYGRTALHLAASRGHEAIVRLLLEKGADVAAKNDSRRAALHEAAIGGHETVVRLLLEKGADIAARAGGSGWTALHEASIRGHKAVVRLLTTPSASQIIDEPSPPPPPTSL